MAAVHQIDSTSSIQSADVVLRLVQPVEKRDEAGTATSGKPKKAILTNVSPTVEPPTNPSDKEGYKDALALLAAYLMAMTLYQINAAKNDSKASQLQNQNSNVITKQAKQQVADAREQADKNIVLIKEWEDASSKGSFLNIMMSVLGCLAAALTGGALATVVAVGLTLFMNLGGAEKLNDLTSSLGSGGAFAAKLGICIAIAVVAGAAGGAVDGISASMSTAADGGASAASSAAKQSATVVAARSTGTNFFSTLAQTSLFINPFTDLMFAILDKAGVSKDKQQMAAQITGVILAIVAAVACSYAGGAISSAATAANVGSKAQTAGARIQAALEEKLGKDGFQTFKKVASTFETMLDLSASGFRIAAGVNLIRQARILFDKAELSRETGMTQAMISYFDGLLDQTNSITDRQVGHYDGLMKSFQMVNRASDRLVAPYVVAGQIQA